MESWEPVVDYEGFYEASTLGRVQRVPTFVEMPPSRRHPEGWIREARSGLLRPAISKGYASVTLCRGGIELSFGVHALVCGAFHGRKPFEKAEACHRDGNGLNNVPGNLYWGTHADNMRDVLRHGRHYNTNKIECKRGHRFVPGSYTVLKSGGRRCKACRCIRGN